MLTSLNHITTVSRNPQRESGTAGVGIIWHLVHLLPKAEHFHAEGRETWLETIEEMPAVFDAYLGGHIAKRPHRGPGMRTPAKTFHDGISRSSRKEGESNPKIAA